MVPVFGFGQNDVFDKQPKIDYLLRYKPGRSKWEKWSKVFLKGVMQVMFARFGVMPYPHPITVVGKFQMILPCEQWFLQAGRYAPVASGLEKPPLAG